MVIGDITSQLISNILLNVYDQFVKRVIKLKHYGHYVDDMYHMHESKRFLTDIMPVLEGFLEEVVHVHVNHQKWRLLSAYDASQYLGAYIRPYYMVPRQRTIDKFVKVTRKMEYELLFSDITIERLFDIRAKINSYCGLLSHYRTYNLRKGCLDRKAFYRYFTFPGDFRKANLRREYRKINPVTSNLSF